MAGLMPNYIMRQFYNDGKLLSGGKIWFYESATLVPKTVYADFTLTTPLSNPVVLDAGASADIFLGTGAYRILVTDLNDVQIRSPIDGIIGAGGGSISEASNTTAAFLATYNDVRTLTDAVDTVYVSGRSNEGDGGAGWFQRIPSSSLVDDDGIVLTANSGSDVYKRVFSGYINPEWYGVVYGVNTDNSLALQHALAASVFHNTPVRTTGSIYLTQNISVPSYAMLESTIDGFFHAGSTITMSFATGSRFDSVGVAFGNNIDPSFAVNTVPEIHLSWMGGAISDDAFRKLRDAYSSSSPGCMRLVIDKTLNLSTAFATGSNTVLSFTSGSVINITSQVDIDIPNIEIDGYSKVMEYNTLGNLGDLRFGADPVRLEWFGAKGDDTNDTLMLAAGLKHGSIAGLAGKIYKATSGLAGTSMSLLGTPTNKPVFVFTSLALSSLATQDVELEAPAVTLGGLAAKSSNLIIAGALNGDVSLDSCVLELSGSVTQDTHHVLQAESTVFFYGHRLPITQRWVLDRCVVQSNTEIFPFARAKSCEFLCVVMLNKLPDDPHVLVDSCGFTHASYSPTLSAQASTPVFVVNSVITNTAPQTYAWANANTWKHPASNRYVQARYVGSTQNSKPIWDPYATSLDNRAVNYIGNANAVAVPFASWASLPAGFSASGNNLYANTDINTTYTPNDGVGFVITPTAADHITQWPNTKASFSNAMGYAIAEIELVSSNAGDYVDLVCSTAPICVVAPGLNFFPGVTSDAVIVRNYSVKHGARCVANSKLRIPVWIGVENSVTFVDSDGTYPTYTERDTTHKLQLQMIGVNVHSGALITVTVREAVVDDLEVFAGLYNIPNTQFDTSTYPIATQSRCVDSYSYNGFTNKAGAGKILNVIGNDLTTSVAGSYNINAPGYNAAPDINLWRCQYVSGTTYYNHWDLQIEAPVPALLYITGLGITGTLSKITMAKNGTTVPSANAQAHSNILSN